jgi:hypothetical protein
MLAFGGISVDPRGRRPRTLRSCEFERVSWTQPLDFSQYIEIVVDKDQGMDRRILHDSDVQGIACPFSFSVRPARAVVK